MSCTSVICRRCGDSCGHSPVPESRSRPGWVGRPPLGTRSEGVSWTSFLGSVWGVRSPRGTSRPFPTLRPRQSPRATPGHGTQGTEEPPVSCPPFSPYLKMSYPTPCRTGPLWDQERCATGETGPLFDRSSPVAHSYPTTYWVETGSTGPSGDTSDGPHSPWDHPTSHSGTHP